MADRRPYKKPGEQQVVVRMPNELHAAAVERAKAEERSLAQLIRYACRRYLDTPSAVRPPEPRQET